MHVRPILCGVLGAALAGTTLSAQAPASEIDAHFSAARAAAGLDYRATFVNLCFSGANPGLANPAAGRAGGRGAAGGRGPAATPDRATWYASPYKVFDNFYWLGTRQHSSWALRTSDGLIIIDTNFAWATEPEIINGLTTLGLDPRQIKYVVISHAHGDHDQGAAELQKTIRRQGRDGRARLGLDTAAASDSGRRRPDARRGRRSRRHEAHARRHDTRHRRNARTYTRHAVVRVSGEGSGTDGHGRVFRRHADRRVRHQRRAMGRIHRVAEANREGGRRCGCDRTLSNHSEYDNAYTKARLLAAKREVGEDHPFVGGAAGVQRYFTVMTECATASKLRAGAK